MTSWCFIMNCLVEFALKIVIMLWNSIFSQYIWIASLFGLWRENLSSQRLELPSCFPFLTAPGYSSPVVFSISHYVYDIVLPSENRFVMFLGTLWSWSYFLPSSLMWSLYYLGVLGSLILWSVLGWFACVA